MLLFISMAKINYMKVKRWKIIPGLSYEELEEQGYIPGESSVV